MLHPLRGCNRLVVAAREVGEDIGELFSFVSCNKYVAPTLLDSPASLTSFQNV